MPRENRWEGEREIEYGETASPFVEGEEYECEECGRDLITEEELERQICDDCWDKMEEGKMASKRHFTEEEAEEIGDELGIEWDEFDVEQFRMGLDVETEHGSHDPSTDVTGDDPLATGKIALAHLNEFPDYYDRLGEMEEKAKKELKGKKEGSMSYDKFAYYDERVKMVRLINNEGEILDKEGYSVEGGGIFDEEAEEYIAGYTEDGEMHASVVDWDDTVLNFEGERTQYKLAVLGESYDKLGAVEFDKDKMLKLIDNDEFLFEFWADMYSDKSEEEKDVGLEVMFNTFVLEDSVMEHKYEHGEM